MTDNLSKYSGLYREPGPWCVAYVDASTGTVDGLENADVLTDARVQLVPSGALPDGVNVAALLRWPTGPEVPAGS